jgi:tetratricopeptide (TPR) repeat protein
MPAMKLGRPSRKLILVLALAGACVHAAPARAAGAEDKFALGTAAFTDGKLDEALKIFQEIWKTNKSYDVAVMLARTERNLEKHRDAADHYAYALANFPLSGEEELREEVKTELADVKKQIGTLRIRVPVKDATVKIGGAAVDAAALAQDIFVNKGKVVIEATAPGYQPEKKTLEVKPGTSEDVIITLQVERVTPRSKVPAIVVGGVGFVGIVIGAALVGTAEGKGAEARKLHDELGSEDGCAIDPVKCTALRDATGTADALGNGGIAAFVLGGLAGAAALGYMLIPTRKPQTGRVAILPVATPSTGGILVSGSF